jgi:cytochrome c-type biogenesis protein CcmH
MGGHEREGHDFSRAEKTPDTFRASAPEVRFWVAQRFSAAERPTMLRAALAAEGGRIVWTRALHALLLTAAIFLFLAATPASTDARFKDLGHRMMCTCGCGQVLLECNHVGCQSSDKMRNQLMAALDKGENDDLILQGFVQEYGPTVIAAPTATGFNKVAWIMPFVALAAGLVFVTWVVRAWKNRPEPALADGITIPQGHELDQFRTQARKETEQ